MTFLLSNFLFLSFFFVFPQFPIVFSFPFLSFFFLNFLNFSSSLELEPWTYRSKMNIIPLHHVNIVIFAQETHHKQGPRSTYKRTTLHSPIYHEMQANGHRIEPLFPQWTKMNISGLKHQAQEKSKFLHSLMNFSDFHIHATSSYNILYNSLLKELQNDVETCGIQHGLTKIIAFLFNHS